MKFSLTDFEDENLLRNKFGLTDIVKIPRNYNDEPTADEYCSGISRILNLIQQHEPKILVFVYKKVLDNILKFGFGLNVKSQYGFNHELEKYFNSKVFVFPMPVHLVQSQKHYRQ